VREAAATSGNIIFAYMGEQGVTSSLESFIKLNAARLEDGPSQQELHAAYVRGQ
jgi:hypothetical protein